MYVRIILWFVCLNALLGAGFSLENSHIACYAPLFQA